MSDATPSRGAMASIVLPVSVGLFVAGAGYLVSTMTGVSALQVALSDLKEGQNRIERLIESKIGEIEVVKQRLATDEQRQKDHEDQDAAARLLSPGRR